MKLLSETAYDTVLGELLCSEDVGTEYYLPNKQVFSCCQYGERVPSGAIALPSRDLIDSFFKHCYRRYLTEDERCTLRTIEQSKEGFSFLALRISGIYDRVMRVIVSEHMHDWERENGLNVDWDNIVIK